MACCVVVFLSFGLCTFFSMTTLPGYVPALAGLPGITALLWSAILGIRTLSGLDHLYQNLAKGQPGHSISRNASPASILAGQCIEAIRNSQNKIEESTERENDIRLKLQLLQKQKESKRTYFNKY